MDIRMRQFVKTITAIAFFLICSFIALWLLHAYIPTDFYKKIFFVITVILSIFGLLIMAASVFLIIIYKNKKLYLLLPGRASKILRWMYPFIMGMAAFLHYDKGLINQFFIQMNNIFVEALKLKGHPGDILILAPHCIQHSSCNIKITSDPMACTQCGKCKVASLKELKNKYGYKLSIATGGTLARRVVKEYHPKYIIAIACERDLISGILDISGIPVYGILNDCPNGPCINTTVNIKKVEDAIKKYNHKNIELSIN
ncbi:MAG: DUF116 domain-containing protein [Epulopiscium sp.]|nr:DUF116 domain-containing protein [Candidatus Epulonipiscium sp.]